jgi:hypothetical protein
MKKRTIYEDRPNNVLKFQSKHDPFFETKFDSAVDGLQPYDRKCINELLYENAKLVVDFINSELQYNNIKVSGYT